MHIIVFTAIPRLLSSSRYWICCSEFHSDLPGRTTKRLELTREVAEGTLNRSVEVLQTITPIHEKVEEWATNMKNQDYSAAAFDRAVVSAGEAGTVHS